MKEVMIQYRRTRGSDRRAGFTLVEVLVAMTVTAVGMTAVFGALRMASDAAGRSREAAAAARLAEGRMVSLLARPAGELQPAEGVEGKYAWAEKVERVGVPDVARAVVAVMWQSRGRPVRYELVSLREIR